MKKTEQETFANINNLDAYFEKGKEVIKVFLNNGEEAYFVGEVVRNKILQQNYQIIEIYTSASVYTVSELFESYKTEILSENEVRLVYLTYTFHIYSFKNVINVESRKTKSVHYSKNLLDFLLRRDFTINALAMSQNGKITDASEGYNDIKKKVIRAIGKPKQRFSERPIRALSAFVIESELGFKIERNTLRGIKGVKSYSQIPLTEIYSYVKRIVEGKYFKRAFNDMLYTKTTRKLAPFVKIFRLLDQKYRRFDWESFIVATMLTNATYDDALADTVENPEKIKNAYQHALANPKAKYKNFTDSLTLYRLGNEQVALANRANYLIRKAHLRTRQINKAYNNLPLKHPCDLAFKGQDVLAITKDNGGEYLISLMEEIEYLVLEGKLKNDFNVIGTYVARRLPEIRGQKEVKTDIISEKKEENIAYQTPYINNNITPQKEENEIKIPPYYQTTTLYEEEKKEVAPSYSNRQDFNNHDFNNQDFNNQHDIREELSAVKRRLDMLENEKLELELDKEAEQLVNNSFTPPQGLSIEQGREAREQLKNYYKQNLINQNPKYYKLKVKQ